MNVTLYGSDAEKVHGLLQRVQEEREALDALDQVHDDDMHDIAMGINGERVVFCIKASELAAVHWRRIEKLSQELSEFGIAVAEEVCRPVLVMPKRPIDEPANSWAKGETT
jgi:hypothetical protein